MTEREPGAAWFGSEARPVDRLLLEVTVHRLTCPECGRVFDMLNEEQASEWYYGHDCEVQ